MTKNWSRAWPAPAKLNLFLHVVGRRADGYHLLQTVFRFVDLCDTLHFEPRSDARIVLATPTPGVPDEQNLVMRAARMLREKVDGGGTGPGVTIHLEKRIPQGGGLGGGSSDAATTLLALNHLWGGGISRRDLQAMGLALGADVPVFIHGKNCFAEGVGECLTDVAVPDEAYLLSFPTAAVPTPEIFRAPELRRDTPSIRPQDWYPGFGRNDLEAPACTRYPEVAQHLDILRRMGDARMTGSGACCFVGFPALADARAAGETVDAATGIACLAVAGLPFHPLVDIDTKP